MTKINELNERIRKAEEKRVGDIYSECVKRGCTEGFLKTFDTRIWLYPLNQTISFLDVINKHGNNYNTEERLKQWEIYLKVILEKRPNHEKADEWREALKLLK